MDNEPKSWLKSVLDTEEGDIERAARWMARNFRSIGGVKFFREQLTEASK